jgi:glycosyltransferase involved in cell wall biosynthesis
MTDTARDELIRSLIKGEINVFSDFLQSKRSNKLPCLIDVQTNWFYDKIKSAWFVYGLIKADIVTCSTVEMRSEILAHTGVVALLINEPDSSIEFLPPDTKTTKENPKVIWCGELREIFSVLPYKGKIDLSLATDYKKKREAAIKKADIVFLPKTNTEEQELNRQNKVINLLKLGKFVIAPDLSEAFQEFAFGGSLQEGIDFYKETDTEAWVEAKQTALRNKGRPDDSLYLREVVEKIQNKCR